MLKFDEYELPTVWAEDVELEELVVGLDDWVVPLAEDVVWLNEILPDVLFRIFELSDNSNMPASGTKTKAPLDNLNSKLAESLEQLI